MINTLLGIGFMLIATGFLFITAWGIKVNKRLKNLEKVVKHYIVD